MVTRRATEFCGNRILLCLFSAGQHDVARAAAIQDFETWPTTASWGTTVHEGWTLSDGQVKPSRGGFGSPRGLRCGWLYDFDPSTNSWILAPLQTNGAGTVSFWVRRNTETSATNILEVQHSSDSTNWTTARVFDEMQDDWEEASVDLNIPEPVYVRIIKTGDTGANQYLGIDDIAIGEPPGILFSGLTADPAIPTSDDPIDIQVQIQAPATSSNFFLQAHYRPGNSGPFTAISMVHTGSLGYETVSPIPDGFSGNIQYFVEGTFEGPGASPVFIPGGGSNAPTFVAILDTNVTSIAAGATWRYFDGEAEPAPDWNELTCDDSSWSNEPAILGYGDPDVVTTISFGPDPDNKHIMSYYRHTLSIADVAGVTAARIRLMRDEGAIVYINGSEVYRNNMPAGPVGFSTTASASGSPDETVFFEQQFSASLLRNGPNLVAVEVHQHKLDTSDSRFDCELLLNRNPEPIIQNEAVSGLSLTSVVLRATLVSTGTAPTQVSAYWGSVDGVTNSGSWQHIEDLGVNAAGPVSAFIGGLDAAEQYHYRFSASNAFAEVWAPESSTFATPPRSVTRIAKGSQWKYLDNGSDQGTAWRAPGFDDSSWTNGLSEFGYGDGDEVTEVSFGGDPTNKFTTTYFRKRFVVSQTSLLEKVTIGLLRDDGAVVYLNGAEVFRDNMPAGDILFTTFAAGSAPDETNFFYKTAIGGLVSGTNLLGVEVHQHELDSSDLSFDLELINSDCPFPELLRGPYLQLGTPTNMTIRWRTAGPGFSLVRYGDAPGNLSMIATNSAPASDHVVTLTNLLPKTRYYYAVETSSEELAGGDSDHWFMTPPLAGAPANTRIWAMGDFGTADAASAAVRNSYIAFNGTNRTDLWLMLGDNAYESGTDSDYQAAVFDVYPSLLRNIPAWPTVGNHDADSANSSAQSGPYFDLVTLPTQGEAGGIPSGTEAYYSFDHANIHFVCMNSMDIDRSTNGTMMTWLKNDLAMTMQEWIIAYWHHPPYSRGDHDSDVEIELVEMRENALPILEEAGVDLVLTGHSHSYERSFYLRGHYGDTPTLNTQTMIIDAGDGRPGGDGAYSRDSETGTVYTVSGSGGRLGEGPLNHPAMFYSLLDHGSLVIDVERFSLSLSFIDDMGAVRDSFTIIDPPPPLMVSLPASAPEAGGILANAGSVSMSAPAITNVIVMLESDDITEVTVPASVTLLQGQTNAVFDLTIQEDGDLDGVQFVTITASAEIYSEGSNTISVLDNESATLLVSLPTNATEGDGLLANAGFLAIDSAPDSDIIVALLSDDTNEVTVPATVIIPSGATNVSFGVTVVDDTDIDGNAIAVVTAQVPNWTNGQDSITILDNDLVDDFLIAVISSPQTSSVPFNATIVARDTNAMTVTAFVGSVGLSGNGDGGAVVISPAITGPFTAGVWNGQLTVTDNMDNIILTASKDGRTGSSNPFDVVSTSTTTTSSTSSTTSTTLATPLIVEIEPDVTLWAAYTPTGTILPMYSTNLVTLPIEWIPISVFSNVFVSGTNVITFDRPDTNASPVYFRLLRTF